MSSPPTVLFAVLVVFGSTLVVGVTVAHATPTGTLDDPVPIDSCLGTPGDVDEPGFEAGKTYILTQDIDASDKNVCFTLEVPGVTILGNGHAISGDGDGTGIEGASGVSYTIRDLTVSNFGTGLTYSDTEVKVYDSVISHNTDYGIDGFVFDEGSVRMDNTTVSHNGVGIRSFFTITRSRIVDNVGDGIQTLGPGGGDTVYSSVIAGNGGKGIDNDGLPPELAVDARFNYWGAADGPSGPPGGGPIADPVTGRIVDGSGDEVSLYEPTGGDPAPERDTSNVRFDPFLVAPPGESVYDGHYQVDLVVGDPLPQFSADRLYSDEGRLIFFLHGQGDDVERTGSPPTLRDEVADCVAVKSWTVEDGVARVVYTREADCVGVLTLVSYEKPGPGFSRETADQQHLFDFDADRSGLDDRTFVLEVELPEAPTGDAASTNSDATGSLARPTALASGLFGYVR